MAKEFDLIVMGGGIIGGACAYEASLRGLKVLLLEKSDFGSETSAGSFKIIHGGLRYLQHFDLPRLVESYKEQQFIRKASPNLVKPLPFLVPCYGYGIKGKLALRVACSIYELISKSRNDGVLDDLKLPNHKVLTKKEVLEIAPLIDQKKLTGGVVFYDCQMLNPDRLTLQVIKSAEHKGAIVRNYNEIVKIITSKHKNNFKIKELLIKDHKNNLNYKVSAKFYINTFGPWGNQIGRLFDNNLIKSTIPEPIYSKGIQLVLPEIVSQCALSIQGKGFDTASNVSRGGRAYFLQPWNGHTLIGTTDSIFKDLPENNKIKLTEIKEFLLELQDAYPSETLKPLHVKFAFGGLRTVDPKVLKKLKKGEDRNGMVNTSRDEEIIDHSLVSWAGLERIDNLISSIGIKYTTFRSVAERVIRMLKKLDLSDQKLTFNNFSSQDFKFYGSEEIPKLDILMGKCMENGFKCKQSDLLSLIQNYGSDSKFILDEAILISKTSNLETEKAILYSKVKFACRNEYAFTLIDLVTRRLDISSLGFPGHPLVNEISKYMAEMCGWDESRRLKEIENLNDKFTFST